MGKNLHSVVCFRWLFLGFCAIGISQARADIGLNIVDASTAYSSSDVWVSFSAPGGAYSGSPIDLGVTYNGGTQLNVGTYVLNSSTFNNALSDPIQLSTITSGSFNVSSLSSEAIYVSYGTSFSNLTAAPGFFGDSVSGTIPFQNVELTYTGGAGDQANLTNINYFTAPTSMTSYTSAGTVIQSTGFTKSTAQVATQLAALTPAVGNAGSNAVSVNNQVIRYIGPSTFIGSSATASYPSFVPYLQTVASSTINNNIVNNSAFNSGPSTPTSTYTNYDFTFLYTSTVGTDGTIVLSGSIQSVASTYVSGTFISSGTTYFSNAGVAISGSNSTMLNDIIYGQTASGTNVSASVTYNGASGTTSGWGAFNNYIVNTGSSTASGIANTNAYSTVQAQVIGEITSAIQMGFLGNTGTVTFNGTATVLDTMNSNQWWTLNPLQAFDQIQQSGSNNYNPWGNAIYADSYAYAINSGTTNFNGDYGIPYSDRLGQGPLVNTTQYTSSGTTYDVSYIDVAFGDPVSVSAVPEPGISVLLVIALAGIAGVGVHEYLKRRPPGEPGE